MRSFLITLLYWYLSQNEKTQLDYPIGSCYASPVMSNHPESSQTPSFEEWSASLPFPMFGPYTKRSLHEAIYDRHELILTYQENEWIRYGKIAASNVFYHTPDERLYRLEEVRYTLVPGKDYHEVLQELLASGTSDGVTDSPPRKSPYSITERMIMPHETREQGTLRAFHEEVFDDTIRDSIAELGYDQYEDLDEVLQEHIEYIGEDVEIKTPFQQGNSYQGLGARYDHYVSQIIFDQDIHTPIQLVNNVPQTLYSFEEGKYLNMYVWKDVTDIPEKQPIRLRKSV